MKKKVIKDFKSLPPELREKIRKKYPQGYINNMINFFDKDKQLVSAFPYETEEISYLIKMPSSLHLDEDEEETSTSSENLPETETLDNIDEEKFLIEEGEEEESD